MKIRVKIRLRNGRCRYGWMLRAAWVPLLLVLFSFTIEARILEAQTPGGSSNSGDPGPALPYPDLPYNEAEAQAINRQIMCPVCPAESIDQAQVPIARQMRQMVRDQLTQGANQAEILEFFAQRYGPDILASPPKSGFNLLAWIFPVVGMAVALIAGWLVIRSMASPRMFSREPVVSPEPAVSQQPGLEPFLKLVDAEIGLEPSSPNTPVERPPDLEPHRRGGSLDSG